MSLELCKLLLKSRIEYFENRVTWDKLKAKSYEVEIEELLAKRKRKCKWADVEFLKQGIAEINDNQGCDYEQLSNAQDELAEIARIEILLALVPQTTTTRSRSL